MSQSTTHIGNGYLVCRVKPASGRHYYFVAKYDGSFISRSFNSKRNATKLAKELAR